MTGEAIYGCGKSGCSPKTKLMFANRCEWTRTVLKEELINCWQYRGPLQQMTNLTKHVQKSMKINDCNEVWTKRPKTTQTLSTVVCSLPAFTRSLDRTHMGSMWVQYGSNMGSKWASWQSYTLFPKSVFLSLQSFFICLCNLAIKLFIIIMIIIIIIYLWWIPQYLRNVCGEDLKLSGMAILRDTSLLLSCQPSYFKTSIDL